MASESRTPKRAATYVVAVSVVCPACGEPVLAPSGSAAHTENDHCGRGSAQCRKCLLIFDLPYVETLFRRIYVSKVYRG